MGGFIQVSDIIYIRRGVLECLAETLQDQEEFDLLLDSLNNLSNKKIVQLWKKLGCPEP